MQLKVTQDNITNNGNSQKRERKACLLPVELITSAVITALDTTQKQPTNLQNRNPNILRNK